MDSASHSSAAPGAKQPRATFEQRDGVQVNQGDVNIGNYYAAGSALHGAANRRPASAEETKHALIESLTFDAMENRFNGIEENAPRTCEWLLETAHWREWRDSFETEGHRRLLWIKGHAGTGKSTCMKFAIDHARSSEAFEDDFILFHFFNARAPGELERSTEGMYRTILVQLLRHLSPERVQELAPRRNPSSNAGWELPILSNLFKHAIRGYKDRPVTCFIDALDECHEDQVRAMIRTFRDLMEREPKDLRFRVCFSSRHYRYITVPDGVALHFALENQQGHLRDIDTYIETRLDVSESPIAQRIRQRVREKAKGVFIWCKLVIEMLNKECDRGRLNREEVLHEKLETLPRDLRGIFAEILGFCAEAEADQHTAETLLCMQWVLFYNHDRERYLHMRSPRLLWWAIQRGIRPEEETEELGDHFRSLTPESLRRYILDISKGLVEVVEVVDPDGQACLEVQVIHESVRDFLLNEGGLARLIRLQSAGEGDWDEAEVRAQSHEKLKEITFNEFRALDLPTNWTEMSKNDFEGVSDAVNALVCYTHEYLVFHANAAQRDGVDQSLFLQEFGQQTQLDRWEQLHLLVEGYHMAPSRLLLTDILIKSGAEALVRVHYYQQEAAGLGERFGLGSSVVWTNLCYDDDIVGCLRSVIEINLQRHKLGSRRRAFLEDLAYDMNFEFEETDINPTGRATDAVLAIGSTNRVVGIFFVVALLPPTPGSEQLLATWSATWPETKRHSFSSFLLVVLCSLPRSDAARIVGLEHTLSWAIMIGHTALVQRLLDGLGASVNARDEYDSTPLHKAAYSGWENTAKLLMSRHDIQLDARSTWGETPLHCAADQGHQDVVRMLLATGRVDINATDNFGRTPLQKAAERGKERVVEMLLASGRVEVQTTDSRGRTPLHKAAERAHLHVVRMLLGTGRVDVNATDDQGRTPQDLVLKFYQEEGCV